MIWQVLVAWEEPTTLYPPWNSPISAPTLHNARRFAFSETASTSCRHLAEQGCYPSIFYHCSSEKTITWKVRKLKKKKINGCIYHLLELSLWKQTPRMWTKRLSRFLIYLSRPARPEATTSTARDMSRKRQHLQTYVLQSTKRQALEDRILRDWHLLQRRTPVVIQ